MYFSNFLDGGIVRSRSAGEDAFAKPVVAEGPSGALNADGLDVGPIPFSITSVLAVSSWS